jgi:thiamine-phosphate pyrophosphorylase
MKSLHFKRQAHAFPIDGGVEDHSLRKASAHSQTTKTRVPHVSPLRHGMMKPDKAMLYAITNRRLYRANEAQARAQLLDQTALWAANGVTYIQLREKDMSAREQVDLAKDMLKIIQKEGKRTGEYATTRLLINGRPDVALATGADGVHLPAGPGALTPNEVRSIFSAARRAAPPCVSISCHTLQEVETARQQKPDCILFAPVFEKVITGNQYSEALLIYPGTGLALLKQACQLAVPTPVFALGGITAENARQCMNAGAAGIAAIRLMLEPVSAWLYIA